MADYEPSETGNWNISESWVNEMIFKPFWQASEYLTLAKFGCSSIEEEFQMDSKMKIQGRLRGIVWAKEKVQEGLRNTIFAIKTKSDKQNVEKFYQEIIELEEPLKLVKQIIQDRDDVVEMVNEEAHALVYKVISRILKEVTEPMNRSDLIFTYREPFDPKKAKKRFKDDFAGIG